MHSFTTLQVAQLICCGVSLQRMFEAAGKIHTCQRSLPTTVNGHAVSMAGFIPGYFRAFLLHAFLTLAMAWCVLG